MHGLSKSSSSYLFHLLCHWLLALNSTLLTQQRHLSIDHWAGAVGVEKRCECFALMKAMLNLPKLENFDIKLLYYHTFLNQLNRLDPNPWTILWCHALPWPCPCSPVLDLSWTSPEWFWFCHMHALTNTQYPRWNPNLPALLWICSGMYCPDSLWPFVFADLGTTQSLFMSWFESNSFPLKSWVDSNQCFQKMHESEVESWLFLGKALEPWVDFIHFSGKLLKS